MKQRKFMGTHSVVEAEPHDFALIHWFGPFTLDEVIKSNWGRKKGCYIITGKTNENEANSSIQYCGVTYENEAYVDHWDDLLILRRISELQIWLGDLAVNLPYARNNTTLKEFANYLIQYYLSFELKLLNNVNPLHIPRESVTIVNNWFNKDRTLQTRKPSTINNLPDVISWDGKAFRVGDLRITYDDPIGTLLKNLDIVAEFEEYLKGSNVSLWEKPEPCWVRFNNETKELSVKFEYEQDDGKPNTYVTFSGIQSSLNPVRFHLTSEKPDVDNSTIQLDVRFDGGLWYFEGTFYAHLDTGEIEHRDIYIDQIAPE